jgi:hypothetical protein
MCSSLNMSLVAIENMTTLFDYQKLFQGMLLQHFKFIIMFQKQFKIKGRLLCGLLEPGTAYFATKQQEVTLGA